MSLHRTGTRYRVGAGSPVPGAVDLIVTTGNEVPPLAGQPEDRHGMWVEWSEANAEGPYGNRLRVLWYDFESLLAEYRYEPVPS